MRKSMKINVICTVYGLSVYLMTFDLGRNSIILNSSYSNNVTLQNYDSVWSYDDYLFVLSLSVNGYCSGSQGEYQETTPEFIG